MYWHVPYVWMYGCMDGCGWMYIDGWMDVRQSVHPKLLYYQYILFLGSNILQNHKTEKCTEAKRAQKAADKYLDTKTVGPIDVESVDGDPTHVVSDQEGQPSGTRHGAVSTPSSPNKVLSAMELLVFTNLT